ncbi:TPA: restriction endonuclease subunit S [Aeromonas sobria]|nr:restriction endonuclease subunit S [Aeromonas sobria]
MSELVATSQQGLVGKYQPYQEYKDSGVEWLGNVPSHWTVTAVKRFASFTTGWTPPTGNDAYFGGEHLWANISDVGHRVLSTTAKTITDAGVRATRIKKSPKGSLLFSFKLSIGLVSIVGEDMYTNEAIATFLPSETFNISYMYWAAPLFIPQNAEENIYGAKLLNQERIGNASFVLPTPKEQRTIAAFLDYETARIDRLIAQQQRLIELLKEKRQAVISHAVTKGLNPNAPMKDSGVEWLGQVPEHWCVFRLKHLAAQMKAGPFGSSLTKDMYVSSGYKIYGQEQVIPGDFSIGDYYISEDKYAELRQYAVKAGDILISCVGTFGKIAVFPKDAQEGVINPRLIKVSPTEVILPEFLELVLRSQVAFEQMTLFSRGGTMDVVNIGILSEIRVTVPPILEQKSLLSEVNIRVEQYDHLVNKAENTISLLKERRIALISAAVTGKIDLRGWTPPADEVAA